MSNKQQLTAIRFLSFVARHPRSILLGLLIVTLGFAYVARTVEVDPEVLRLLPSSAKVNRLIDTYAGDSKDIDYLILLLENENPFTLDGLKALEEAILRLESLDAVLGSLSPLNFVTLKRDTKSPVFTTMSPGGSAPSDGIQLEQYREKLTTDPLARNLIVSDDRTALSVIFPVTVLPEYGAFLDDVRSAIGNLKNFYTIRIAGWIPLHDATRRFIMRDPPVLVSIALAITLLIFYLSFRTLRSVILPVLTILVSIIWNIGFMSILGVPLTVISIMIPPLLFALGSSYSIHILNSYYRQVTDSNPAAIAEAIAHVARTITLAAATTAIGFSSLIFASIPRIREFGLFTATGVLFCALVSLLFYPAVLVLLKDPRGRDSARIHSGFMTRITRAIGPKLRILRYVVFAGILLLIAVFALTVDKIGYESDFTSYYRREVKALEDNRFLMDKFGSFVEINLTVTAPEGQTRYFLDSSVLQQLAQFEEEISNHPDISRVVSFITYLKAVNFAISGAYELPEERSAAIFLSRAIQSLSDSAKDYVDGLVGRDMERLTFRITVFDGDTRWFLLEEGLSGVVEYLQQMAKTMLPSESNPEIWGWNLVALELSKILSRDQLVSILVSALSVFLVTSLSFRSIKYGFFSLIPLGIGVLCNFVFMWVAGMSMDVLTIMFASVAIGIGIDDSIHLLIQYRRFRAEYPKERVRALINALERAGRPILLTSVAIIVGLSSLFFSSFLPVAHFGLLICTALLATTFGALVVLPCFLLPTREAKNA